MSQSAAIFDRLAAALAEIRPRFGAGGFSDRRRVIGLLADKVPDAKREIRAVGTAIDEGIPAALARTERQLVGVEMDRLANSLEASTGLRIDLARQVVRTFAFALDLGPAPSIYEAAGAPSPLPPPAPPAATGGWTGLSTPVAPPPSTPAAPPPYTVPPAPPGTSQYPSAHPSQPIYATGGYPDPNQRRPNMAGRIALGVGGIIVVALGVAQVIDSSGGGGSSSGGGSSGGGAGNNIAVSSDPGFANELTDYGIAATSALNPNLGSPTPLTIGVAQRVTTREVERMIAEDPQLLLVDVLADPHDQTIQGAAWLPSGGSAGSLNDSYQGDFVAGLTQLTGGARDRPLVFFCAGANCWESYNAALRANAAGFSRLFWYRGGLAAWMEAGLPTMPLSMQGATPQQVEQPVDPGGAQQAVDLNGAANAGDKVPTN